MPERKLSSLVRPSAWREPAGRLYRSRRLRKSLLIIAIALLIFGLLGALAAPPIIRSQLQSRLGALLQRPVEIRQVHLNPFSLRLTLDGVHIGDHDGHGRFVDIDRLVVDASWSSLFRLAPILDELELDHPQLAITRDAPQHFNFSDIIERLAGGPPQPDAKPTRFALSNISVHQGDIVLDDRVEQARHEISGLELGIPFIANLPSAADVFVKPLLAMNVDGSPLRLQGQTKPFASTRESVISFHLDRLDLPRYLSYVPEPLPVKVSQGQLSGDIELHFVASPDAPKLGLNGRLRLDQLNVTGKDSAPLLSLGQVDAELADVQPLQSRYQLGAVRLDRPELHYTSLPGGHSNFDALLGDTKPAPGKSPAGAPMAVNIAQLSLSGGRLVYADRSGKAPAELELSNLQGNIAGLATLAAPPAKTTLSAQLNGGQLSTQGELGVAAGSYHGKLGLQGIDIKPLQALAAPDLAAELSGKLGGDGQLSVTWKPQFNLQLNSTRVSLAELALKPQRHPDAGLRWKNVQAGIAQFDLAAHRAQLDAINVQGLEVQTRRLADGQFDLATLAAPSKPAAAGRPTKAPPAAAWHWRIERFELQDSALTLSDEKAGRAPPLKLSKLNARVEGLSDDFRQPLKLDSSGTVGKNGDYRVGGTLKLQPLAAELQVKTSRLDLAPLQSYVSVPLNVSLTSALLSNDGRVRYAEHAGQPEIDYGGRVALNRVRVQDKLSGDDFLRWNALNAGGVDVHIGSGAPKLSLGALALNGLYARVIVNSTGRLNLQDVVASPTAAQPVSVTRAEATPLPASTATATPAPASSVKAPAAQIRIGGISLADSQLNYTDNFIKPNYTANITQLSGKVGSFGTTGGDPAPLSLQGSLDDNSPVDIEGTINPLAPVAFLDITGKAEGVELTHLSTYSSKYTGYPIVKGRLNANVHYQLDQGKLAADNHIFIDQLTFGDKVDSPGVSHLPVKLAVALLKDSQGRIDVDLPVSGSLDDPKFSVGGLIWHAFVNLIGKAVTSPFRLLGSAFGGGSGGQDLGYVEFAPGSSALDAEAQKRLTLIVKALHDRPSLNLDITGRVDPSLDQDGLRKVTVDQLVQDERRDDEGGEAEQPAAAASQAPAAQAAPAAADPKDEDKYLERAYKHAKFKKPRNLLGLHKSEPPEEMRQMLEANVPVDQDAMRHLAERRADAVRGWLHGKIDDKRIFVLAPKLDAKGIDDKGKTTRTDFGLH